MGCGCAETWKRRALWRCDTCQGEWAFVGRPSKCLRGCAGATMRRRHAPKRDTPLVRPDGAKSEPMGTGRQRAVAMLCPTCGPQRHVRRSKDQVLRCPRCYAIVSEVGDGAVL